MMANIIVIKAIHMLTAKNMRSEPMCQFLLLEFPLIRAEL